MTCKNPSCRHQAKRKLRPLVISLIPSSKSAGATPSCPKNITPSCPKNITSGNSRHEQITHMFKTHPSLATHFEPPTFSPGVSARDLRNRLKLLEHANRAGLIPDIEWREICRALSEQGLGDGDVNYVVKDDHDNQEEQAGFKPSEKSCESESSSGEKHKVIDPFRYLATTSKVQPVSDDATKSNKSNNSDTSSKAGNKSKKKRQWLEYETKSLVPISPERQGSTEDISLPYSMELWRKAKTLNRDRSVLACTLAHLIAMKTLVGANEGDSLDNNGEDGGFDFILEDNVRALTGLTNSACECADRIWDTIEASNDAQSQCHMRYYGWLGSLPNISWIYENHIPRSAFNSEALRHTTVFPFPTSDDFELDSIDVSKSRMKEGQAKIQSEESLKDEAIPFSKPPQTPHFEKPGGTQAVWGTFAYTISPSAYRTLIHQLQNDVGSLMWKGKRMRAYQAKPIDKVLPRHIKSEFGPKSIHLPDRVAFVRAPMLGSLLHPHWEEGFCNSTELQYHLSHGGESSNSDNRANGSDVWDNIFLSEEEIRIINHRRKHGKWIHKGTMPKILGDEVDKDVHVNVNSPNSYQSLRQRGTASMLKVTPLAVIVALVVLSISTEHFVGRCLPFYVSVDAFSFNMPFHHRHKQQETWSLMSISEEDAVVEEERQRGKLGKVPIISRKIPIEIKLPVDASNDESIAICGDQSENSMEKLDVTIWEMDKPSDLIQEWWSIDESERSARVGDPFGVVMWPGSILASRELMREHYYLPLKSPITNATVLVLGAGTGVEAQTAALLGAKVVVATDINPLTLKLLEYGAKNDDRIGNSFEARFFDMFSSEPLPPCDILIAADVLYNPDLAKQVGRRLHEAIVRSFEEGASPTKVIITDSQKFHGTNFLEEVAELKELNTLFKENGWEELKWEMQKLESIRASGVLVDEDQVYDVQVRVISWGW
eukprot:CAMPEP_0183717132 /NCGR_PEP_ID=MMETSP0737-20130205/10825_1 /TAXON_ID=385413 /ORGANISM="Thalassiosira miniscula, Strain CCMP1093" /LENGTH=942 /DNA_ID=CAMNT_0025946515 /DNA_START=175 /DNA_END=3000 /DNA_ORIENTATION=+